MLDQQLVPAVQILPPQSTQLPAAQAGGQRQQVIHPVKQWFLQDALQQLLHFPRLRDALGCAFHPQFVHAVSRVVQQDVVFYRILQDSGNSVKILMYGVFAQWLAAASGTLP